MVHLSEGGSVERRLRPASVVASTKPVSSDRKKVGESDCGLPDKGVKGSTASGELSVGDDYRE